jgi:RNA polymerase-interacting CarD/CdnL/TRCF family regulator
MDFHVDDWVIHCTHGLGRITAIEDRTFDKHAAVPYYVVQVSDLTIWVSADEKQNQRLRLPVSEAEFRTTLAILSSPAETLSSDRRQRNLDLLTRLEDGRAESLCRVIRDLAAYRHARTWNEYDNNLMRRAQKALLGEWCFILSVTPHDAEIELQRLLTRKEG